jgi:hypothetical protein
MAVGFSSTYGVELCTVSGGTTVSCGANNTGLSGTNLVPLDSTHFVVTKSTNVAEATVSGTSILLSSTINFDPDVNTNIGVVPVDSTDVAGFASAITALGLREITLSTSTFAQNYVAPLTIAGIATNGATAGGSVNVIYQGIVNGLSGLTTGSTYYSNSNGTLITSSLGFPLRQIGYALSSTSLFITSQGQAGSQPSPSTVLFADAIFANNFCITEGKSEPQALNFLNENGEQIASLDENGNLTIPGHLISADNFAPQDATTTASSTIGASFADASQALQSALSALGNTVIRVFGDAVYATTGIFDEIFVMVAHIDQADVQTLCVGNTCLTENQIDAVLQRTGVQASNATTTGDTAADATTTTDAASSTPASTITTDASTTDAAATTTDQTANATTTPAAPTITADATTTGATDAPATTTAPEPTPLAPPTPPSQPATSTAATSTPT